MSEATPSGRVNLRSALLGLAAYGLFASHDAVVKTLGGSYSPVQVLFFSVVLSFPLVTVLLVRDTARANLRPAHPWWTALRTGAVSLTGLSAFTAFSLLPLAQVYAILFASPLIITLLSIPVLGERVRLRRWIAILVGLCGVLVVLQPGAQPLSLGHLAALGAAIGGSTSAIVVRRIGKEERSVVLLLYPLLSNFVLMGAALPFVYEPMPVADLGGVAAIAVFAVAATLCQIGAYRDGEAVIVAPMQYSQILWATAYGMLFFGERPGAATAIGATIVIASGLYILIRESRVGASRYTPVLNTRSRAETGTSLRVGLLIALWQKAPFTSSR